MKKRTFLKKSSTLLASSALMPIFSCETEPAKLSTPKDPRTNWAGNLTYSTDNLHLPETVEQVQEWVNKCEAARALGSRHCFNAIADSQSHQISLARMNKVVSLDEAGQTVTVEAGIRYGELSPYLHERGFALHNLASLPHISVAGACATATHGSGMSNGNLASVVRGIEFVDAGGNLHQLSAGDAQFPGAVVHLGGLGVITKVTLGIEPTYEVTQDVFLDLPKTQLEEHFEEIMSAGYSVSLFTDYKTDKVNQVWIKRKVPASREVEPIGEFFEATAATRDVHPIIEISAESCTQQMAVPGPWYERLPHFRMNFTPSSGKELQTEYFVPRSKAIEAINAIYAMADQVSPLLMITEIRSIDADDLWMSPCYQEPCIAIHFTWEQDWEGLKQLLPTLEKALAAFEARPHWGKIFGFSGEYLSERYSQMPQFKELLASYDPNGKFRNDFMNRYIFYADTH